VKVSTLQETNPELISLSLNSLSRSKGMLHHVPFLLFTNMVLHGDKSSNHHIWKLSSEVSSQNRRNEVRETDESYVTECYLVLPYCETIKSLQIVIFNNHSYRYNPKFSNFQEVTVCLKIVIYICMHPSLRTLLCRGKALDSHAKNLRFMI
jgi:hypothetical protein